jgi:PAS domain S-box-containing protein
MGIDPAIPAPGTRRHRYRDLFVHAPVAYLVTDPAGTIREANRLAGRLLGVAPRALAGQPLRRFVAPEDVWILEGRVLLAGGLHGPQDYDLRIQARRRPPAAVRATVDVARERSGHVRELRWLLRERQPAAGERWAREPSGVPVAAGGAVPVQRMGRRQDLAGALEEAVAAAAAMLHADAAGLTLRYEDGGHRWMTATGSDALAFEEAQRNLGQGPYLDAIERGEVVWSTDLPGDRRWPRLRAVAPRSVRGVLAAPVGPAGAPVGAGGVLTTEPRQWRQADAEAMRAYAAVLERLLLAATEASRNLELADQLQQALDRRVLIEQAKGVVMARAGLGADQAFALIRREARSRNRRVVDIAGEVISGYLSGQPAAPAPLGEPPDPDPPGGLQPSDPPAEPQPPFAPEPPAGPHAPAGPQPPAAPAPPAAPEEERRPRT